MIWYRKHSKMAEARPNISVITSNVNGLYSPVKRQSFVECAKKTWSNFVLSIRDSLYIQRHTGWEWKDGKRYSI